MAHDASPAPAPRARYGPGGNGTPVPPRGGPGPAGDGTACALTVTLRDSRGALGRIAAALSGMPVLALSYAVTDAARATAEVRVPQGHAARARGLLDRMVEALSVTEPRPVPLPVAGTPRSTARPGPAGRA
ncbi:hypothetical protein GCM10010420_18430 [Streptomyces glaucosporus]|uniref:ACT domain-containing protein n=1 Tax=Streptomyces glaucosporus TaxID=284044 RepID=A0ABP5V6F2_9ACTN